MGAAMTRYLVASKNQGKVKEMKALLAPLMIEIVSLDETPDAPEVPETGNTFVENAVIKATAYARYYGLPAIADDSGLEVDALNGRPGIYSARFAGERASDDENNRKLMEMMRDFPDGDRGCRYVCAIAVASPERLLWTGEGVCKGRLLREPRGRNGFGYDPYFYLAEFGQTMAELAPATKNRISHRAQAMSKLIDYLDRMI
jgi:XTP/dITP diphosphohydrolase